MRCWTSTHTRANGPVTVQIIYLCEEAALDLDNILKPIIDALIGFVVDDGRWVQHVWVSDNPCETRTRFVASVSRRSRTGLLSVAPTGLRRNVLSPVGT